MSGPPSGISKTENNTDDIHNEGMSREDAYKLGVSEIHTENPTIFLDPDQISTRRPGPPGKGRGTSEMAAGRSLRKQLDAQVPGSARAFYDKMGEDKTFGKLAKEMKRQDPAALSNLDVEGEEHGLAVVPRHTFDTKREMTHLFTGHFDRSTRKDILENMPGTNNDWMRFIGNHEGAHLTSDAPMDSNLETMTEEVRADRIAMDKAYGRGQGDIALAFKDLRALSAGVDPTHASTTLTNSGDRVTGIHLHAASATKYYMDKEVKDNFNWDNYGGSADTPKELLKENPRAYFNVANKGLGERAEEVLREYEADPSLDNQKNIVGVQAMIGYQKNFEDAYRRRVLGEDIPERAPIQLFSQAKEDAYVDNIALHDRIDRVERFDMDTRVGNYGEFGSNKILEDYDWASHPAGVSKQWGISPLEASELYQGVLQSKTAEVLEDYKNNPSLGTLERVLTLQTALNEAKADVDLRTPGVKPPTIEPIQLISESEKEAFLIGHVQEQDRLRAIDIEIGAARWGHQAGAQASYTDDAMFESFDWDAYDGEAKTAAELARENPEVFNEHVVSNFGAMKQDALDAYGKDPSYENTGKLLEVQYFMSEHYDFINRDNDSKGLSTPPLDTSKFVPENVEVEYYRERIKRMEAAQELEQKNDVDTPPPAPTPDDNKNDEPKNLLDKGYTQGVDGTAYTTEVNMPAAGEPKVDFENGVTVSDQPISNFFNKIVSPSDEDVKFVSATKPESDVIPDPSIITAVDNTQTVQAFK